MKYGQLAEGSRINDFIYRCFHHLPDSENKKFVREFKQLPHDKIQVMHTFRELILGAYLAQSGLCVSHNYAIDSKTPDWCVLGYDSYPQGIIELVNFHPDALTSADIANQIQKKGIWCNFVKPNTERLYYSIWKKVETYKSLVARHGIPYVVSVFGDFTAIVEQDELEECLFIKPDGFFNLYSEISGVLYFEESSGVYFFTYKPNPQALHPMSIPGGTFQ